MDTLEKTKTTALVMTVTQAAEYLGLAVSTLNKWRCYGCGPVFVKMGRSVRYRKSDLDSYMKFRTLNSTADYNFKY